MSGIFQNYQVVDSVSANFLGGSLPSWLSSSTTGGSVSVEAANGGRATLSTGTGSTGDFARVQSSALSVDAFDAILIRAVIEHGPDAANGTKAVTSTAFEESSNNYVKHLLNSGVSANYNTIEHRASGTTNNTNARENISQDKLTSELLWDTVDGKVLLRYQDSFAGEVTANLPSSSLDYKFDILCQTNDTAADRQLHVYEMEVEYLQKLDR